MAKRKTSKKKTAHKSKRSTKRKTHRKPKSLLDKLKHWLEKRGQGLPMTTIVIIVIVLIVLAVVVVFFFGQFNIGATTAEGQQNISISATASAKCSAWATGLISSLGDIDCSTECPCPAKCTAIKNGILGSESCTLGNCLCPD